MRSSGSSLIAMAAMAIASSAASTSTAGLAPKWTVPAAYFNAKPMLLSKRVTSRRTVAQDKRAALKRKNRKRQ